MTTMDAQLACSNMDTGCCLWIGAGLTVQIAGGAGRFPQWAELTSDLEKRAGLTTQSDWDYPARLDACAKRLGNSDFEEFLRKTYYTNLSAALLNLAKNQLRFDDFIPPAVRQVACLGQVANPIVNFNIEPFSSILIGRPAGAIRLLSYSEPRRPTLTHDEASALFRRLIYHPHGLATGSTVMTRTQYEQQRNTLAFALAVHAAFGCDLAIVGMSLEDAYLREHIARFRGEIGSIYWFDSEFGTEPRAWAEATGIEMLKVDWPAFWSWWFEDRSHEINEEWLCHAWYRTLLLARDEISGGHVSVLAKSAAQVGMPPADNWLKISKQMGETGQPLPDAADLFKVVTEVENQIQEKGFALPSIAYQFP